MILAYQPPTISSQLNNNINANFEGWKSSHSCLQGLLADHFTTHADSEQFCCNAVRHWLAKIRKAISWKRCCLLSSIFCYSTCTCCSALMGPSYTCNYPWCNVHEFIPTPSEMLVFELWANNLPDGPSNLACRIQWFLKWCIENRGNRFWFKSDLWSKLDRSNFIVAHYKMKRSRNCLTSIGHKMN